MFNCTRIKSIEYYEAQARIADAEKDAGLRPSEIGRDGERRDAVSYYQDNGASDAPGRWYVRRKDYDPATGEILDSSNPTSSRLSPLRAVEHGLEVDGKTLRRLAAARDPESGQPIENTRTGKPLRPLDKDDQPKGSVGYDMQISAPKSVSVLAMVADEATRAKILAAHDRAVERALDFVVDDGLLYSRSGKGGHDREKVTEIAAARYRHLTSRAGDPQLHTHSVFLNMARRADGSMGTIDNQTAMQYGGAIAAMYRTELAAILKAELGIETVQAGRNFEVAGIGEDVVAQFSKRRAMIEAEVANTAKNRQAAQVAAFNTRGEKDELPSMADLEARWQRELSTMGWTGDTLLQSAQATGRTMRAEIEKAKEAGDEPPTYIERAQAAVDRLMQNEAVFERRQLFRAVLEELQTSGATADEAIATIARMEAEQRIIKVGMDGNEAVYSTGTMVELERNMLRAAIERQGERQFVAPDVVEAYIAKNSQEIDGEGVVTKRGLNPEQADAVRHVLNDDGVCVVEGLSGTGKSFSTLSMKNTIEPLGFTVHGIAPSWKAAGVLRADAELAEEMARAVAGFLNRLDKGEIKLDDKAVILLDEAGMVGTEDMARLMAHAKAAGAKLILQGDTRQLQPVVAGAPMKALATALGAARLQDIQRQKGATPAEGEWMRAASVDLATGDPARAMEAYDRAGMVRLAEDRDTVIADLVADYIADREIPDFLLKEDGKPSTRAILTGWNIDVAAINAGVRAAMQEKGLLAADAAVVQAMPRSGGKPESLGLAQGDEIIFGEQIKLADMTINNADIARIASIEGDAADPLLVLEIKGEIVRAKASELVGYRDPEGDEPHVPRMQHAYAMTIHASQGISIDRAWVANIRGMGRESLYVSMTRHKVAVKMFAETGRIYDALMARSGGKAAAVSAQGVSLPEEDDTPTGDVTPDAIKKALFDEGMKSDRKNNASDFVGDMRAWLGLPPVVVAQAVEKVAATEAAPSIKAKLDAAASGFKRFTSFVPFGTPSPTISPAEPAIDDAKSQAATPATVAAPSPAQQLAQRQEERRTAPAGYRSQWSDPARQSLRITQDERDTMVRANLEQFAVQQLGYAPSRGERGVFVHNSRTELNSKGESVPAKITVANKGGVWLWTGTRGSSEGGMIWDLVARDIGKTVIEAQHWLRDRLKTFKEEIGFKTNAIDRSKGIDPEAIRKAVYRASKMISGPSPYLTGKDYAAGERGLDPALLRRLGADVKSEGVDQYAAGNERGAAFVYRDAEGKITGYSRRGYPRPDAEGKVKSFRQVRGEPNVWQAQDGMGKPNRIYVSESAIDAISRYQIDGAKGGALLTATEGNPGPRALAVYTELARRNPMAEWHIQMDDDKAGRELDDKVKKAIRDGNPEAQIVDRKSPDQFKDANDELCGITREMAEKTRAERQQQRDDEAARKREAEEQRKRDEEAAKAQEPQHRPRLR